jgi:MFS family permease
VNRLRWVLTKCCIHITSTFTTGFDLHTNQNVEIGLGQCIAIIKDIGASFNITNPGELSWLIAGYSLTVGTFILVSGRLGDMYGYKRMLIIGYCWFALWSMIAGLAIYSNKVLFIFARIFQGIGPAIVMPNGLAILGATYAPGKRKAMVFSIFGACAPNGSVLGSLFASLFAMTWWPWAFFSFAIALAATAVAAHFIIPDPPRKLSVAGKSLREQLREMDWLGAVLGITALVLFNFAWNQAPIVGWNQPYVIVTLILGVLLVPVFFYVEARVSSNPLIPFDICNSETAFVLGCIACGWSSFGIWFYYAWSFILNLKEVSPLLGTAYVAPVCVSGALAAISTGWLLGRFRPSIVMTMALTAFTVGTVLLMTTPVKQTYWAQLFVTTVITPWGMDMSFPAATLILSNAVKKEHQGIAASLVSTVVNYSISLGLGFAGTVEVHTNGGGKTPSQLLTGYRNSLYTGLGLSSLGLMISLVYLAKHQLEARDARKSSQKSER